MRLAYSSKFKSDLSRSVHSALGKSGIINVPLVAEEVRKLNEIENIALEDIESMVLDLAQLLGAPIEFDSLAIYVPAAV
ncbi:hypothetical protein SAZ10_11385 [Mesorhizobium sp. BAC0120]|uniref:hypothetical protein n=1 Tax=Mesorhizobium sp. BAC0120 TaxID=3090670 RepID=UPI00298CDB80|nr:hypothetical protein [Mesorhizobium sp. BAC0120]MDW6022356.1 hypothetical protein [Mesorhizobium sp. BAC0120]